jgi:hypothetical protein
MQSSSKNSSVNDTKKIRARAPVIHGRSSFSVIRAKAGNPFAPGSICRGAFGFLSRQTHESRLQRCLSYFDDEAPGALPQAKIEPRLWRAGVRAATSANGAIVIVQPGTMIQASIESRSWP